ncbi:hypothetical protein BO78DRAFT_422919 [Aspergillus sclerotiicarbonarius CBS 121057]|uniref:Uncharacterized protein n=1 Tax=Aspergillus sclerotiicarbonarius (strain CBS 121057 / IBT 28362) TaxID=1448318 RepID=A0A319DW29_ASPSB|nr:hypothetical protein BO78DRAFT_422919 [Aspergillus sclerotiicarbonarius CBS 121057]
MSSGELYRRAFILRRPLPTPSFKGPSLNERQIQDDADDEPGGRSATAGSPPTTELINEGLTRTLASIKEPAYSSAENGDVRSIFLDPCLITPAHATSRIPRSKTFLASYSNTGASALLDRVTRVKLYLQDLACYLPVSTPTPPDPYPVRVVLEFNIVTSIPDGLLTPPTTLRGLFIHTAGFVHENIHPETIIVLSGSSGGDHKATDNDK